MEFFKIFFATTVSFFMMIVSVVAEDGRIRVVFENGKKIIRVDKKWNTCSNLGDINNSQTIVTNAVREWARFNFPIWEIGSNNLRLFPRSPGRYEILPNAENPIAPGYVPRLIRQGAKEDSRSVEDAIGEYWAIIRNSPRYRPGISEQRLIWENYPSAGWAVPWSAAFVSWIMCESGLEMKNFRRRAAHSQYIFDAIKNGDLEERYYKAYNLGKANELAPGDILCADRQSSDVPYVDNIEDPRIAEGRGRQTHCDIIVKVDTNRIYAIGGNVIDGASMTITPVDEQGNVVKAVSRFANKELDIRHWFAVLRLKENENRGSQGSTALSRAISDPFVQSRIEELTEN